MPIISNFPGGSGSGGGGLALAAASNIKVLTASGKVYVKWTDPEDMVVGDATLATWAGTVLVRKAGSKPTSRRDGTIVLDSKERDKYKAAYFCDSGLTNGVEYFYKLFPYSTSNTYTDSTEDEFSATPNAVAVGDVSGITLAAAGNGKLSIKWTDPAATVVNDGVTLATWASTVVVVKAGGYATSPTDPDAAYTFTSTTRNAYAANPLVATGLTNGTTYCVSLFPMSTDGKANTNAANRKTGVANKITISNVPAQSGTLTYNGNSQTPSWSNYNSAQLTLGGTTSGTNATSYNATFTPKADYMWSDGSTTAKTVSWSIGKAAGSMTLSASAVTLNSAALTAEVTVTRPGDGAITASSSNTGVATVSVSGNKVTIKHVNQTTGTATITIKVAAGTNHTAPADKTVAVTAQFMPTKKALNDQTWAEIRQVSDAGQGSSYWSVGDRKAVLVNGTVGTLAVNQTLYVYILGFNHNSAKEGNGIQFGTFKTALSGGTDVCLVDGSYNSYKTDGSKIFNMNHWGNYNYGGWKACDLRYDILGSTNKAPVNYGKARATSDTGYDAPTNTATSPVANTLMAALPADLRAVMKPITKYTDNKGNSSDVAANVTSSLDYLPLLAEQEIFGGNRTYSNQYEKNSQVQYAYYSAGNSKVKYRHSATGSTAYWWERSPRYNGNGNFCLVHTNGNADSYNARDSRGLAPAFMV
jgi:hypothetical protein